MIKMAKLNNPSTAGKYPETKVGLLALEELDLSGCSLTGRALICVTHWHFTKPKDVYGVDRGGGGEGLFAFLWPCLLYMF